MSKKGEDQKLLDMFAVAALQGLLAGMYGLQGDKPMSNEKMTKWAYDLAKALLDERRKRMEGKK